MQLHTFLHYIHHRISPALSSDLLWFVHCLISPFCVMLTNFFFVSLTTAGEASMPDEYSKYSGVLCEALHPKCSFLS